MPITQVILLHQISFKTMLTFHHACEFVSDNIISCLDMYKKELQKITSSWDETLTAMFEGQNGVLSPPSGGSGGDSVHLVDERPPTPPPVCPSYCPELRACISEKLWCDGEIHCPLTKMDEISCDSWYK